MLPLYVGDFVGRCGQEEKGRRVAFVGSDDRTTSLLSMG